MAFLFRPSLGDSVDIVTVALGKLDTEHYQALAESVSDIEDIRVLYRGGVILGNTGNPKATALVRQFYSISTDRCAKQEAIRTLARLAGAGSVPDSAPESQGTAIEALLQIACTEAVGSDLHDMALRMLANVPGQPGDLGLVSLLDRTEDVCTKTTAVQLMAKRAPSQLISHRLLKEIGEQPSSPVAACAIKA